MKLRSSFVAMLLLSVSLSVFGQGGSVTHDGSTGSGSTGPAGSNGANGTSPLGTSTTSLTVGTGSATLATQSGLAFAVGQYVRVVDSAATSNWMEGQISAYSGTSMTVGVTLVGGSGTIATWNIVAAGVQGQAGAAGSNGSGDLTKIAQTVLSSPASTITFSAIPGSYATLELIVSGGSASGSNDELVIGFNSDGAAHYSFQCMEFYPSMTITTLDHSGSGSYLVISGSGQSGAGINAFADIKIMNYTSTSGNNGVISTFAYNDWGIGQAGGSCGGSWFGGTAAITSISVKTQSGSNLPSGTTATLYGLH